MLSDSARRELAGAGCALASAVLFGTMPLMAKTAFLHGGSPAFVASARFLLGSLFCLPLLQASHASWRLAPRQLGHALLLSLLLSSTLLLLFSAYGGVGTGLATALHFTYPAAVLVLACLVFRVPLSLLDVLCDDADLMEDLSSREQHEQLRRHLQRELTDRERRVLALRYGLDGRGPLPQREVALRCGISRSYVSRRG